MAFKLDLSKLFNKLAFTYAQELNGLIRKQIDVDSRTYQPVVRKVKSSRRAGKTVKQHERRGKRLVDTGRFNQQAFIGKFGPTSMSVEGNIDSYDADVTYNDIIAYNDRNSTELRGKHGQTIKARGPAIVPRTDKQFFGTQTGQKILPAVSEELLKQVEEEVARNLVKNIQVKFNL